VKLSKYNFTRNDFIEIFIKKIFFFRIKSLFHASKLNTNLYYYYYFYQYNVIKHVNFRKKSSLFFNINMKNANVAMESQIETRKFFF
jgi:hypothetical protein